MWCVCWKHFIETHSLFFCPLCPLSDDVLSFVKESCIVPGASYETSQTTDTRLPPLVTEIIYLVTLLINCLTKAGLCFFTFFCWMLGVTLLSQREGHGFSSKQPCGPFWVEFAWFPLSRWTSSLVQNMHNRPQMLKVVSNLDLEKYPLVLLLSNAEED